MIISPIKTHKITTSDTDLLKIFDTYITDIPERSILAVTSKIVALCEGRVAPSDADKDTLIRQEADYYLPRELNRYHIMLTIKDHILAAAAGIDESNVTDGYVLWPQDPQRSANMIREHLVDKYQLKECGVVITDSKTTPLRWGVTGIGLSHSGFLPLNNYIGTEDLFGRQMKVTKVNVMDGLSASAVYAMGEGKEQTPLVLITDAPHIQFQDRNPTQEELDALYIDMEDDLYGSVIGSAPWEKGEGK